MGKNRSTPITTIIVKQERTITTTEDIKRREERHRQHKAITKQTKAKHKATAKRDQGLPRPSTPAGGRGPDQYQSSTAASSSVIERLLITTRTIVIQTKPRKPSITTIKPEGSRNRRTRTHRKGAATKNKAISKTEDQT